MALDVYVKSRAKVPGTPCGDDFWYAEQAGRVWLTVVDGLGSGELARAAAQIATDLIRARVERLRAPLISPASFDARRILAELIQETDRALRGTRGAAIGLAILDAPHGKGHYAGVGNIDLRVIRQTRARPISQPGILGAGVRKVTVEAFPYAAGDLVLMHSDGLSSRFDLGEPQVSAWRVDALGEMLVRDFSKPQDDLTLVVLRQYA